MKVTTLFLFLFVFCLSAETLHSQNTKFSLQKTQAPLGEIIEEIEQQSNYLFVYTHDVDIDREYSVNEKQATIQQTLDNLFATTGISYDIEGSYIVLSAKQIDAISSVTSQQPGKRQITGTVVDETGETVIGANVLEKGTTNGTMTDMDGNFSLSVSPGATLVVSYVGYKPYELKATSGQTMNITLEEDVELLDEVVVVGFGTQKKVNLTGAVGVATAEDIQSRPVTNVAQALQGLVPGLQIGLNTGELDKDMQINVRGVGTIGDDSSGSPLILIDGMEGDINTINPEDVENISVLKDAAASSIYGSRAPFGVILITTKSGKEGRMSVNYNNSFRIGSPIHLPEMMDSYTFANFFNDAARNAGNGAIFTDQTMQQMLDFQAAGGTNRGGLLTDGKEWGKPAGDPFTTGYANTDWFDEIYKDQTFSQQHNVSMTGGNEKITFYSSFGYLDQNGLLNFGKDGMQRYNLSAKINAQMTSWLRFQYSLRFMRRINDRPTNFNGDGFYDRLGRQSWPNTPIYDENGFLNNLGASPASSDLELGGKRNQISDRVYHQGAFILEPIKNWFTHVELNYSTITSNTRETSLPVYNHDVAGNLIDTHGDNTLYLDNRKENYLNLNIFSEYSHTFNEAHTFKVMAGFQAEKFDQAFFSAKAWGLLMEDMPELDLTSNLKGNGSLQIPETKGDRNKWATAGFFGRINYDYKGRYLAEMNMRYDGASRFREGSRWALYPSFSLGWNIAREEFWEPLENTIGTLKLRGSYGELGNQNTKGWYPTYRLMEVVAANGNWLQGGTRPNTARVGALISTMLTWERIRTWNVGLDYGIFDNRLSGSFDFFNRFTDDMVGPPPQLPATLGIDPPRANNADLKSVGWELSVGWNDRLENGFGYGARLLLSDAQMTVESYEANTTNNIWDYYGGKKLGQLWGYETVGIAKTQEEMDAHLEKVGGQPFGTEWGAGDVMYADLDGKPGVNEGSSTLEDHGDLIEIGNDTPRYLFGFNLNADYKGFDLGLFFQGVMKRDIWNSSNMFWGVVPYQWNSMGLNEHGDYFRVEPTGLNGEIPANLNAYYPRPVFDSGKNHEEQTGYVQDASYIRLKNLQVGYTLPASLTKKIAINRCRIFVSADNLWTGTNLSKLFDPETVDGGNDSDNGDFRHSGNAYPLSKTWSFGISVTL